MRKIKESLSFPFNDYWKSYLDGECPFCKSKRLVCSTNGDLFWCRAYCTYVSDGVCECYASVNEGKCDNCCDNCGQIIDYIFREEVEDEVIFCEDCHHGVNFTEIKIVTDLFEKREKTPCKHCQWHLEILEKYQAK